MIQYDMMHDDTTQCGIIPYNMLQNNVILTYTLQHNKHHDVIQRNKQYKKNSVI